MDVNDLSTYTRGLNLSERKNYFLKLKVSDGELPDPYCLSKDSWSNDIKLLPDITWRDVTTYLIDSPSIFTKSSMKAYKSLEAYDYFLCGHVQDCFYNAIPEKSEFCFIKSEVLPSQRQGQKCKLYDVWVSLHKKDGWVLTGNCSCMAGLGSSCSHIAALLFKLEAAAHYKLNLDEACTSKLCSWKAAKKFVAPASLSEIDFSRPRKGNLPHSKNLGNPGKKNHYSVKDPTYGRSAITDNDFKKLIHISPNSVVFTSLNKSDFDPTKDNEHGREMIIKRRDQNKLLNLPEPLTSIFDPTSFQLSDNELNELSKEKFLEYCTAFNQHAYDNLKEVTLKQSSSTSWMVHRAGRITASNCYRMAKIKKSDSLIASIMQYKPEFTSKYTDYGKRMEPVAKNIFYAKHSKLHINFQMHEVGLVIDARYPHLGASPDATVSCNCHGKGVLEIKCPYKYKNGLFGWQSDAKFPLDSNQHVKSGHPYYYQIQLQMMLTNVNYGYLYVHSNESDGLLAFVKRDNDFIKYLCEILNNNFLKFILPEIVSRKMDETVCGRKMCVEILYE